MRIDIRKADKDDISDISDVVNATWRNAYCDLISKRDMERFTDKTRREEHFAFLLGAGNNVFALYCDGKCCAVCTAVRSSEKGLFDCVEILQLYVLPEYQGRRFGKKLLSHTLCAMRKAGYKRAVLWVMEGNEKAIGFYKKFGFKADGKRDVGENFEGDVFAQRFGIEL